MAAIDSLALPAVILEQIPSTPAGWQPIQRIRALEYERDGKIRAAQLTPSERVLERLQAFSSMNRFKLWVEGPNDLPPADSLTRKLPGVAGNLVVQQIGGWGTVLSANWSPRGLGDGCSDFMMLFDGDRARDWTQSGHPVRPTREIQLVIEKLERYNIEYHILERYAIENYFPQSAFEHVMGQPLGAYFSLDPSRSVESQLPGYRKEMNGQLADATTLADLNGTDLGPLLERIRERVAG